MDATSDDVRTLESPLPSWTDVVAAELEKAIVGRVTYCSAEAS